MTVNIASVVRVFYRSCGIMLLFQMRRIKY